MFQDRQKGFSLLEMLVAILLLLIISGTAFQAMSYYQKNYLSTQLRIDMHSSMRAAVELMTQEVGQAGLLSFTPRTLSAGITANSAAQSVTLSSTADIFVGEKLLVDVGSVQELVSATAVTSSTVTGVFSKNHASGATVTAVGIFPQGIMSSSTSTQLRLFGDLYGDGSLVYAQYDCDWAGGTFSRSITPVSAASISPSQVLIANVVANPPKPPSVTPTPCFQFQTTSISGTTFVTSVGITISVRTAQRDPQTGAFVTMTKSFLNIAPRNVLAGLDDAQNAIIGRLQPTPPNLPLM
jgi:prepilin-type N-terminal cleavage/methylation domain-containing protein